MLLLFQLQLKTTMLKDKLKLILQNLEEPEEEQEELKSKAILKIQQRRATRTLKLMIYELDLNAYQ